MQTPFSGVLTALVTPFLPGSGLDLRAFGELVECQMRAGIHGVVVGGTTGESPCLSDLELKALLDVALAHQSEGFSIYIGTGTSCTAATVERTRELGRHTAHGQSPRGALVVCPPYNRPTQDGLRAHFRAVAAGSPGLPLCLYNVPGRTGADLLPSTALELAATIPEIVALKEASGDLIRLLHMAPKQSLRILWGDDPTFAYSLLGGAAGVISVATHLIPRTILDMWAASQEGNLGRLGDLAREALPLCQGLFSQPNPLVVKWLLAKQGRMRNLTRLPLVPLEGGADLEALVASFQGGILREWTHGFRCV